MWHGQIVLGREQRLRLLSWGIRFFLAAALTASQTPGGYAPFALGCVAAAGPGAPGMAALLGAAVGAALFLDFQAALPFLAAAVLIHAAATALRDLRVLDRPWALPAIGTGMFLAVAGIYVAQSLSPLAALAPCAAAAVLTCVSAWAYRPLLDAGRERLEPEGAAFLGASLLLALGEVQVLGISLGRGALCLLVLFTAYQRGAVTGAAMGLGTGLMADLTAGEGGALFSAAYGLSGLLAGSRAGRGRAGAAAVFLGAAALSLLPQQRPLEQPLLPEALLGAALFLLLPGRVFGGKRVLKPEPAEPAGSALDKLRSQLGRTAAALRDLYESMGRGAPAPNDENPAIVFDRAAEKVCRGCALCELCWQREYTGTFNALNDATPYLLERGRALPKDFPSYFTGRCIHLTDFLTAVDGELSAFLLRRQYRRQLEEARRSARGQYAQLSELLTATAAGLGEVRPAAAAAAYRIGAVLRPKTGERVCGDTVAAFETEGGMLCLLLCDGMGSGEPARKESALTCRLMRQFLEAGIEPEAALKTLNAAMALRSAETGSFTTIDLITCRPGGGEAAFYKFGAAPSYLKRGGTVRRVTGGSLPAGVRSGGAAPDVTRATLEPGGFIVQISDGVADPSRDEWLQDLLAGWEGEDPQELAGLILGESVRREGLQDDCGIQVLSLPRTGSAEKV